jgi:hypothetical protein
VVNAHDLFSLDLPRLEPSRHAALCYAPAYERWKDEWGTTAVVISPSGCYIPQRAFYRNELVKYLAGALADLEVVAAESTGTEYQTLSQELGAFSSLAANWNGEGARAMEPPTTARARELLHAVLESNSEAWPSIGPMPDGRYSFTWEANEKELWIYVSETGYTSHQWDSRAQFESIVRTWRDPNTVAEFIEWLKK